MAKGEGLQKLKSLEEAGFSGDELVQWRGETAKTLTDSGFSGKEVDEYFGVPDPDMNPMKKYFEGNLQKVPGPKPVEPTASLEALPGPVPTEQKPKAPGEEPKVVSTFMEALESGWDMSVSGLIAQKKLPDVMLPEDAPTYMRIASQVSALAGDIPAMIAGSMGGSAIGASAGPVGAVLGGGAGAFAAPTAIRETLMQHYEKGDIQDFQDFWERSSSIFIETMKSAAVGAATVGVGGVVAKGLAKAAAPIAVKTASTLAAEVATMVTVGKALEGELPNAHEFLDAGIVLAGLKGSTKAAGKLRNIYAKTGIKPHQVTEQSLQNPVIQGELLAVNVEVPKAYEPLVKKPKLEQSKESIQAEPAVVEPKGELSAQEKILSQVGEQGERTKAGYSFDKFYRDFVDKLDPINEAVKTLTNKAEVDLGSLPANKNPYILSRMANDYKAKTKHFLERAPLDFKTLEAKGRPLSAIIEPHNENLQGLDAYLISKRAIELEGRGIQSGFDVEAAKTVVKEGKQFAAAAKEIVDFQNSVLTYAKDAGILSDNSFKTMTSANQKYIPFKRILEIEEGGGSKKGKASSLKEIKGSERKIQSPMLSVMENTEALLKMAEKNRAVEAFVKMGEEVGSSLVQKVPGRMKAIEVKQEEIARELQKQGIEVDADSVEAFNIFRPQTKNLAPTEFEVFRHGKREVYKTTPELAEAFKALDGDSTAMNLAMRFARGITTVKKLGIAFTPEFILRNVIRDQITAGTFSKGGAIPVKDMFSAMGDVIKKKDVYYNWLKSGGANGSFMELNQSYLEANVFKLNKETGFIDSVWNVAKKPVEIMRVMAEITEQGTRLAEFKKVSEGQSFGPKVFEGGYASREVTVDFQRMGAKMSALNSITAFQNIAVQGLDRTVRALKEDPGGVATKALVSMTLPSVLLWYANKDDPRWKEIPRWQKDLFWIVMTEDTIYRVPKPQELGILFGSLPERALEAFFTDNPDAMKGFNETMGELITPALVPDAISPVMEQYFNKSMFTGNPIVPRKLEGIAPAYQYTEYTSETGKLLSKFVAVVPGLKDIGSENAKLESPIVIENYIRSWTGTVGMYAVQLADQALTKAGVVPDPVKPASTLADIPFVKAFVIRYPSAGAQSIQDFYEKYNENKKVIDTIRHLAQQGDFENMTKEFNLQENRGKLISLYSLKEALNVQSQFIGLVNKNPNIPAGEKRQFIDGWYMQMIEAARQGNTLFKEIKESTKDKRE